MDLELLGAREDAKAGQEELDDHAGEEDPGKTDVGEAKRAHGPMIRAHRERRIRHLSRERPLPRR